MVIVHRVLDIAASLGLALVCVQVDTAGGLSSLSQRACQLLVGSIAPVAGASRMACTCARSGNQIPSSMCSYLCGLRCGDRDGERKQEGSVRRGAARKTEKGGAEQGTGTRDLGTQNTGQRQ